MLQSDRNHFAILYNTERERLESLEKISAQTTINLSRMKNRLAEIDFSFGAQNPAGFRKEGEKKLLPRNIISIFELTLQPENKTYDEKGISFYSRCLDAWASHAEENKGNGGRISSKTRQFGGYGHR